MKTNVHVRSIASGMGSCPTQAAAYGKCIASNYKNVSKGMCQKEFETFKQCVQRAVSCTYKSYKSLLLIVANYLLDEEEVVDSFRYTINRTQFFSASNLPHSKFNSSTNISTVSF